MTQKHAPDRIWFTRVGKSVVPNSYRVSPDDDEYFLATPAREAAHELLEALETIQKCSNCSSSRSIARAAIAKVKGETP